jgi:transcriptional regulator with XRE-family HTH domain
MLLKDYRKLARLTRQQTGDALGVTGITIWRWETGRAMPGTETLLKIKEWSKGAVTADDVLAVRETAVVQ